MSRFHYCLEIVLRSEGDKVDHKLDKGGRTAFGVTQRRYDEYRQAAGREPQDVWEISSDEVDDIYGQYWRDAKCGYLPEGLDLVHFDMAINSGVKRANKTLQRVLGVDQDGIIGRDTLNALHEEVVAGSVSEVVEDYLTEREDFYRRIVFAEPAQKVFLRGWLNRLDHLRELV